MCFTPGAPLRTIPIPPVRVVSLRLRRHTQRPAVAAFAAFIREAFAPGGLFAPGSIAPPRIDAVEHLPA